MRRLRYRVGLPGIFFLAALVLVPVALAGHRHAAHAAQSTPCATCLTVLHAPAAGAPPVAHVDPVFVRVRVEAGTPAVHAIGETPVALGRAPPASSPVG